MHDHACSIPACQSDRASELARLSFLARKVAMVHGHGHPSMVELSTVVNRLAADPASPITPADRALLVGLTDAYTPWPEACGSVRALLTGLAALPDRPLAAAAG